MTALAPRPIREGDFVLYRDLRHWHVDEVFGDCAWIQDKDGADEWVRVSDLDRVRP